MRLLLDTHVLVWWTLGNTKLPPRARDQVDDPENSLAVSVASIWEVAIKNAAPRGESIGISAADLVRVVERAEIPLLPITAQHAKAVEALPKVHGDPFDRLIVAVALSDTYRLVTHDRMLGRYGADVLLV